MIDGQQASAALNDINDVVQRVRQSQIYQIASLIVIMWGVLVSVGYFANYTWPPQGYAIWLVIDLVGIAGSIAIAAFSGVGPGAGAFAIRLLMAFLLFIVFGIFCTVVLGHFGPRQMLVFWAVFAMLFYALAGLWFGYAFATETHHQGVLAISGASPYSTWEDFLKKARSALGPATILILDNIEDPQNLGSLIRTAEACGVQGVIIPKDRAVGITPAVVKASAGAAAHLPVIRVTNLATTLEELMKEGFLIVGADSRGEKSLYEMKFDMNVGLVIGSEGKGIRPLVLKKCDYTVAIPMRGKISSLSAAKNTLVSPMNLAVIFT